MFTRVDSAPNPRTVPMDACWLAGLGWSRSLPPVGVGLTPLPGGPGCPLSVWPFKNTIQAPHVPATLVQGDDTVAVATQDGWAVTPLFLGPTKLSLSPTPPHPVRWQLLNARERQRRQEEARPGDRAGPGSCPRTRFPQPTAPAPSFTRAWARSMNSAQAFYGDSALMFVFIFLLIYLNFFFATVAWVLPM